MNIQQSTYSVNASVNAAQAGDGGPKFDVTKSKWSDDTLTLKYTQGGTHFETKIERSSAIELAHMLLAVAHGSYVIEKEVEKAAD